MSIEGGIPTLAPFNPQEALCIRLDSGPREFVMKIAAKPPRVHRLITRCSDYEVVITRSCDQLWQKTPDLWAKSFERLILQKGGGGGVGAAVR